MNLWQVVFAIFAMVWAIADLFPSLVSVPKKAAVAPKLRAPMPNSAHGWMAR